MKIKFKKIERDCPHNKNLGPGEKMIYDYEAVIDGKVRAVWFRKTVGSRGYTLRYSLEGFGSITISRTKLLFGDRSREEPVEINSQQEMLAATQKAIDDNIIPSDQQRAALVLKKKEEHAERQRRDAIHAREGRIAAKSEEMYKLIQLVHATMPSSDTKAIIDYVEG